MFVMLKSSILHNVHVYLLSTADALLSYLAGLLYNFLLSKRLHFNVFPNLK